MIGEPRMSAASVRAARTIRGHREVAALLIQERVKTLVVALRQIKQREQRPIAAARFGQAAVDERRQISARELTGLERLTDDGPEILARLHSSPQRVRSR